MPLEITDAVPGPVDLPHTVWTSGTMIEDTHTGERWRIEVTVDVQTHEVTIARVPYPAHLEGGGDYENAIVTTLDLFPKEA